MSKQIDERVVSMEFDNSKFNNNVQDTVKELDNLKQSLKFDDAKNSFSGITNAANSVNLSHIEKSLDKIQHRFSTFGIVGATVLNELTKSAMSYAKKSTNWLTQGIVKGGINRAKNIQKAKFQLEGLKVEWDAIKGDIDYAVSGTAYGMDSAAKAASQLVASSVKLGDPMKTALRGISGLAAMTNSSYDDMARIFTTVAGNGRLMGDQLNQISARGINAAATLGKYLNKSEKEIREMTGKGQIDFATFAAAMDDAFGEHAKAANQTFDGAMSNVRAALGRIGELFVTPLIKDNGPLVKFFNQLRMVIDNVKAATSVLVDKFLDPVIVAINKATTWMTNLYDATSDTYKRFVNVLKNSGVDVSLFEGRIEKGLAAHGYDVDKLKDKYGDLAGAMASLDSKEKLTLITSAMQKNLKNLDKAYSGTVPKIEEFYSTVDKYAKNRDYISDKDKDFIKNLKKQGYEFSNVKDLVNEYLANGTKRYGELTDAQLKSLKVNKFERDRWIGYHETAKLAGTDIDTYIRRLLEMEKSGSGATHFLNGLYNIFQMLTRPLEAFKTAFKNVFGSVETEEQIYGVLYAFDELTAKFVMSDKSVENLTKTFQGLMVVVKYLAMVAGGAVRFALLTLSKLFGITGGNILDFTGKIGDLLYTFDNQIPSLLKGIAGVVLDFLKNIVKFGKGMTNWSDLLNNISKRSKDLKKQIGNLVKGTFDNLLKKYPKLKQALNWTVAIFKTMGLLFGKKLSDMLYFFKVFVKMSDMGPILERLKTRFELLWVVINKLFGHGAPKIQAFIDSITKVKDPDFFSVINAFERLKEAIHYYLDPEKLKVVGGLLIDGLVEGIVATAQVAFEHFVEFAKELLDRFRNVLGIHSPSTETREIGRNLMEGLVLGLEDGANAVIGVLRGFLDGLLGVFDDFDSDKLLAVVGLLGTIKVIKETAKEIKGLAGLIGSVTTFLNSLSALSNEAKKNIKYAAIKALAESVLMLAVAIAAIAVIAHYDMESLKAAVAITVALMLALIVMINQLASMDNEKKAEVKLGALAGVMAAFAAFVTASATAIRILATIKDPTHLLIGIGAYAAILLAFGGMLYIVGRMRIRKGLFGSFAGLSLLVVSMSASLMTMAMALGALALIPPERLESAVWVVIRIGALIGVMAIVAARVEDFNKGALTRLTGVMLGFAVSLAIIGAAMFVIGNMSPEKFAQANKVILEILITVGAIVALSALAGKKAKNARKNSNSLSALFASFGVALIGIAIAMKTISELSAGQIIKAIAAIGLLGVLFVVMVKALDMSKIKGGVKAKQIIGLSLLMLTFGASLMLMATALSMLAQIPSDTLDACVGILLAIGAVMVAMIVVSADAANAHKAAIMLISIAVVIIALAAALTFLSVLKPTDILKGLMGILPVMALLAVILHQTKYVDAKQNAVIISLTVMIGLLCLTLVYLTRQPWPQVLAAALALSSVIGALVLVLKTLDAIDTKKALPGIIAMSLGISLIAFMMMNLASLPFNQIVAAGASMVGTILALSLMFKVLTGVIDALTRNVMAVTKSIVIILSMFIVVAGAIVALMYIIDKFDIDPSTETINNLIKLLGALTLVTIALVAIGSVGPAAITAALSGLGAMTLVIVAVITLVSIIGRLMTEESTIMNFVNKGLNVLQKLASGLGQVVGAFVGGIAQGAINMLPTLAEKLDAFAESIAPFMKVINKVDKNAAEGAKYMAEAICILGGAEIINAIAGWVTGEDQYKLFGDQMAEFGHALVRFSNSIDSLSEEDIAKIKIAAEASKALAEFAKEVPNLGGLVSVFTGDNAIDKWGDGLASYGGSLKKFADKISDFEEGDITRIKAVAEASKALAEMGALIPKVSGMFGKKELDKFGKQLPDLGKGIGGFSENLGDSFSEERTIAGADAVKALINALSGEDLEITDFGDFANQIEKIGNGVASFYTAIEPINVMTLGAFIVELGKLVGALISMKALTGSEADGFNQALKTLMNVDFENTINKISSSGTKIGSAIEKMFGSIQKAAKTGGSTLDFTKPITTALDKSLTAVNGYNSKFTKAGATLIKRFYDGINGGKGDTNKFETVLKGMINSINEYKGNFESSGKYLAQGFANGINLHAYVAKEAARNMAKEAKKSADNALAVKSPSREMMKTGKYFVEGFAKGVENNNNISTNSASTMAMNAMSTALSIIDDINDAVNDGLTLSPTITPVLDPTNLNSGLVGINGSLNSSYAFGLSGNLTGSNKIRDLTDAIVKGVTGSVDSALEKQAELLEDRTYQFDLSIPVDGREVARTTAKFTQEELNRLNDRSNRLAGYL